MNNVLDGNHSQKKKIRRCIYISIAILIVLLNALAWNSTAFCDAYIFYIFPVWVNIYGRLTGIFPFSVGEWLLAAGLVLVIVAFWLGPVTLLGGLLLRIKRGVRKPVQGKSARAQSVVWKAEEGIHAWTCAAEDDVFKGKWAGFVRRFYIFFAWICLTVGLVMTLNCSILYHVTPFSEKYFEGQKNIGTVSQDAEKSRLKELFVLWNLVATRCNELSGEVVRDETDIPVYAPTGAASESGQEFEALGSTVGDSHERVVKMVDKARENMQKLGKTYDQLDGWYPRPKPMFFSDFMCQQYMEGYYFPFSMEANYNDVMNEVLKPACMCHELAHLRGYIFEDEANFIAYLACVQSDDAFFQYSGYLSVLGYLQSDLYQAYQQNPGLFAEVAEEIPPVAVDNKVHEDNTFVSDEEWDRINGKALLDTEVVDAAADVYVDVTLKANGVTDGMISYSRVVELLLLYYRSLESGGPLF